jgi:hypothetical protein
MKTMVLLSSCLCACMMILTGKAVVASSDASSTRVTWGRAISGLQCGLSTLTPVAPLVPVVQLSIRNLGATPIQFYDQDFHHFGSGFSMTPLNGSIVKFRAVMAQGSEIYVVGGPPLKTTVGPGRSLGRVYEEHILTHDASGPFSVSFEKAVRPVGAPNDITLSCGQVTVTL